MTEEAARAALEALGARFEGAGAAARLASFGDAAAEAEALRAGAGARVRPRAATTEVSGTRALDYLHRMLTQDLRSLPAGEARHACALTRAGRLLGDPVVWGLEGRALLTWDGRAAAAAVPVLERHVVAEDVAFVDRSAARAHLSLAGPGAPALVTRAFRRDPPAPGRFVRSALGGGDALVLRRDLGGRPAFEVVVDRDRADAGLAALAREGARLAGEDAWDVARVETGTPAYGAELDERVLPNEAGLESAISWTKGCYLGQEPVVMAKHRGHPPSLLCRLSVEGPAPGRDADLRGPDGRRVGRVTTAVPAPAGAGSLALGYVAWDSARSGTVLSLPDDVPATVVAVLAPGGP